MPKVAMVWAVAGWAGAAGWSEVAVGEGAVGWNAAVTGEEAVGEGMDGGEAVGKGVAGVGAAGVGGIIGFFRLWLAVPLFMT